MDRKLAQVNRRRFLSGLGSTGCLTLLTPSVAFSAVMPTANAVLLVVDVQNCFLPDGTLPVSGGNEIIPIINALGNKFKNVIFTQDWHTPNHASFASSHRGKKPFETIQLSYGNQVLWPDNCVQGSDDANLAASLHIPHAQLIIRKGYVCGLATDFCVSWSAIDARRAGLDVWVIEDACRGIDLNGSLDAAWQSMAEAGVKRIHSSHIA